MILATFRPRLAARFRSWFRLRGLRRPGSLCSGLDHFIFARLAAVALDRTAALEHHVRIIFLRGPCHGGGEVAERMTVGGTELGGEIDVAAKLQHAVVIALE